MPKSITFIINLICSFALVGIIWFVQHVHYPLFSFIGEANFKLYLQNDVQRIYILVAIPMVLELITSLLMIKFPPKGASAMLPKIALGAVLVVWLSSLIIILPIQSILGKGFHTTAHNTLVLTNWIRTLAWSFKAAISTVILYQVLNPSAALEKQKS